MSHLRFLFKVSRPRFWIYVFGPYLVGLAAGATLKEDLLRFDVILFGLYFLLPANLLIYGINDIFDWETDRFNPKKGEYETLVRPESHRSLAIWMIVLNLSFLVAAFFLAPKAILSLAGFLFFSIFYSAPPIRAKSKPFLDSFFNILYVMPGVFSYALVTNEFPPISIFTAAGLWTMAMHAYSAIPDIEADRAAGIATIATLLGTKGTLMFCLAMYIASAILAFPYLGMLSVILGLVYAAMIAFSLAAKSGIFAIYRYFPFINSVVGFVIFWSVALKLFFP